MGKEVDNMIGIIAAMEVEMEILKEALRCDEYEKICGMKFYQGVINDNEVILTVCGVGKVNAAMAATVLINTYKCDFIINTGIAGGITGVNTRDIIIANKLTYSDVNVTPFGYEYGQVPGLPMYFSPSTSLILEVKKIFKALKLDYKEALIYTGDYFVNSLEYLKNVDTSIPCIAEMEGAAIAHVCVKSGIDFIVLRYVSDIVGLKNQINDYLSFETEMANRSANICLEILKKIE